MIDKIYLEGLKEDKEFIKEIEKIEKIEQQIQEINKKNDEESKHSLGFPKNQFSDYSDDNKKKQEALHKAEKELYDIQTYGYLEDSKNRIEHNYIIKQKMDYVKQQIKRSRNYLEKRELQQELGMLSKEMK